MKFSMADLSVALGEKKTDERLVTTLTRLVREGKIKSLEVKREEETRILSYKGIKTIFHKRGYQTGAGTLEALEADIRTVIDMAVSAAKLNHRKTVKPVDVNGASLSFVGRK